MRIQSRLRCGPFLVAVTTAAALSLTACGSTGDNDSADADLSSSQQECMKTVNTYLDDRGLLPETLPEDLTPLSKPPANGLVFSKLVWSAVPTDVEQSEYMKKYADEIGWDGKLVSWDGTVEDANDKLIEAAGNSDVTFAPGPPPAAVQAAIKASKANDVLMMLSTPEQPESIPGFGAVSIGAEPWKQFGVDGAYMVAKETDCKGNVAVFGSQDAMFRTGTTSVVDTLKSECKDCESSYTEINISDIGTPAATNAVISKLQSDPSIDFVFFIMGNMAAGLEPALKQAGLDVQVGGILPSAPNLAALKSGDNTFWVGVPQETSALVTLDSALRALDTGKPAVGSHYPAPIFTQDNVTTTDNVPAYPKDIGDQFKKLWLVD